ncbi:hypothetical protein Zmor_020866 [Zophobas morio]|uniref:Uncharacterized protein n=1 Tax=Zophobas morio TaxID=2755281 RepID=A0AA38I491_9CUCU|nr:hypothetical protein Zmor_020866 [Zophobas morio]
MADQDGGSQRVVCFVCSRVAVKKRIFCADCQVWSHIGCAERKPCCMPTTPVQLPDPDDPNAIKYLVTAINSLTSSISDMKKSINDILSENKKLRKELEDIKTKGFTNNVDQQSDPNIEEVISEARDRNHREKNIIITGLPETNGSPEERKRKDMEKITQIISTAIPENDYKIMSAMRLGKSSSTKPRSIKIVFDNSATVNVLVRAKPKIDSVYFNNDLTPMQQQQAYNIRKELRTRRENGEKDLRIRYKNGMPTIIKATKNLTPIVKQD